MWPQLVTEPDPWRSQLRSPCGSSCPQTEKKDLRVKFMRVLAMFTCLFGDRRSRQGSAGDSATRSECVSFLRPQAAGSVGQCERRSTFVSLLVLNPVCPLLSSPAHLHPSQPSGLSHRPPGLWLTGCFRWSFPTHLAQPSSGFLDARLHTIWFET